MGKSSLCWLCDKTCGGCSWTKEFKPVKGWQAIEKNIKSVKKPIKSYMVIKCPEFKPFACDNKELAAALYGISKKGGSS